MNEGLPRQSMVGRIDRYFRREDTLLANGLRKACSLQGTEYRNSKFKRNFELTITAPVALLSIPVTALLGLAAKVEDGGSMFFSQERVGKDGKTVEIVKISFNDLYRCKCGSIVIILSTSSFNNPAITLLETHSPG